MSSVSGVVASDPSLVAVSGFPFPLGASARLEERACQIGARCAAASDLLSEALDRSPQFTVVVLAERDWPENGPPYGMPH